MVIRPAGTLFVLSIFASLGAQPARPVPAVPVEPISAILDAFRTHQLVAIGDPHGNEQAQAFRLSLVREPRLALAINDIVVEFGNARYQDLMDRFMRGEAVSEDALRDIWQNTTVPGAGWDRPIYEEFFRAVRAVNASLPQGRQLRVLLGDPPIDWEGVRNTDDLMKWMRDRDTFPAALIQREVLAKQRRALIIYGDGHFLRIDIATLVSLLERDTPNKVFTVWTNTDTDLTALQSDVATWRAPTLAITRGTTLGATALTSFIPIPGDAARSARVEDQYDAVLYLGSPSSMTTAALSPTRCVDTAYMEMRTRRMRLLPPPPGAPDPVEQLRRYCARISK